MKKTALIVMAAGIGSRYGAGIKQLAKIGPSGEIIMDYSVHDALAAGFDKLVFVIRRISKRSFVISSERESRRLPMWSMHSKSLTLYQAAILFRTEGQSLGERLMLLCRQENMWTVLLR